MQVMVLLTNTGCIATQWTETCYFFSE